MSIKSLIYFLGIALFALLLASPINSGMAQIVAQNVAAPYAITFDNILTDNNGNKTAMGSHVDEQRRNGDRSQLWSLPDGHTKWIIEFISAGLTVSANDANSNISTLGTGRSRPLIPNYTCLTDKQPASAAVGKEDILGWPTTHYSKSTPSQKEDSWVAGPELGCVVVKRVVQFLDNGQAVGSSDSLFATKIIAGDPPDADFSLPANPVEMPPSQFESSISSDQSGTPLVTRMDAIYQNHKALREAKTK